MTAIFTVAVLLFVFVSLVAEATVTVSEMIVPAAVPAATLYTTVIVPVEPGGTLGFVQETGALIRTGPGSSARCHDRRGYETRVRRSRFGERCG